MESIFNLPTKPSTDVGEISKQSVAVTKQAQWTPVDKCCLTAASPSIVSPFCNKWITKTGTILRRFQLTVDGAAGFVSQTRFDLEACPKTRVFPFTLQIEYDNLVLICLSGEWISQPSFWVVVKNWSRKQPLRFNVDLNNRAESLFLLR